MPAKKTASNYRAITIAVEGMCALALELRDDGRPGDAERLRKLAADLDAGADGRETQERRRRKTKTARKAMRAGAQ